MIIQAADAAGIAIPRFCYHDKLPIAANCRMCLVDVEKAPKPMPACASPVTEGMKVYTQSKRALDAQRNVMEFLLINHPLDCPMCDQGGECELQDLSIGYGRSVSRFVERKRVVADEDLGPLIATDMTRCIHCTRCVRFVAEIAGTHELGGLNRGEQLEIGTYIGKSIESELSGNIIDVCPVGALTNKVFRFRARAWELAARESVGYHDALGSNLWLHVRRGEVLRAVPRDNDAINECWLSDRDRYSHEALESADRLAQPQLKRADGQWRAATWDEAIAAAGNGLRQAADQHGGEQLGALVAPWSTLEEGHLAARLLRGLGSENIDHRLRVLDFADAPVAQPFALPLAAIERAGAILLVGSNPRHDAPLLGHRVRKAWKNGAAVYAVNPVRHEFHFETRHEFIVGTWGMAGALAALAKAAAGDRALPDGIAGMVAAAEAGSEAAQRRRRAAPGRRTRCWSSATSRCSTRPRRCCARWRASSPRPPAATTTSFRPAPTRPAWRARACCPRAMACTRARCWRARARRCCCTMSRGRSISPTAPPRRARCASRSSRWRCRPSIRPRCGSTRT